MSEDIRYNFVIAENHNLVMKDIGISSIVQLPINIDEYPKNYRVKPFSRIKLLCGTPHVFIIQIGDSDCTLGSSYGIEVQSIEKDIALYFHGLDLRGLEGLLKVALFMLSMTMVK